MFETTGEVTAEEYHGRIFKLDCLLAFIGIAVAEYHGQNVRLELLALFHRSEASRRQELEANTFSMNLCLSPGLDPRFSYLGLSDGKDAGSTIVRGSGGHNTKMATTEQLFCQ